MNPGELLKLLTSGERVSLAEWYADPLSRAETEAWLAALRSRLLERPAGGARPFGDRLAEMIVRYWTGQHIGMEYENLLATAANAHDRAQLELCYGQLLLARKHESAWEHLDAGFEAAAHLFEPAEYFVVLRRHECLKPLPLSAVAREAMGLDDLLREASVVRRLQGRAPARWRRSPKHQDTTD